MAFVRGDIDGIMGVNVFDVIRSQRIALLLEPYCGTADLDCDRDVDLFDVLRVSRKALSLPVTLHDPGGDGKGT